MEPLTIIALVGLALSAAGTGAGMVAQNKAQRAQDAQRAAELYRQSQYSKKAGAVVDQQISEASADKAKPAIDAAAAERAAAYNRITAPSQQPAPTKTVSRTVSTPFAAATANQSAISNAWNRIIGAAQAKAGAYQDWGLARNIAQQRAGNEIALIGRDARGSAGVSAAEQADASREGDALAAGGQLLGVAGLGVSLYGATQASPAAETVDPYETAAWGQDDWSIPRQSLPKMGYGWE